MKISTSGPSLNASQITELNSSTAPAVRDEIRAALKPEHTALVLDLSATKFVDSSGLGAIIALQKTMAPKGGTLRILNPTPTVMQILELTRLHRVLDIVRST